MYTVKKSLNNNEFIGVDDNGVEAIVVSKGIGFNLKPGSTIDIKKYPKAKVFYANDQKMYGKN